MTQTTLYDSTYSHLNPNEFSGEFHCHWFAIELDRCVESCNTVNELSKNYVLHKTARFEFKSV